MLLLSLRGTTYIYQGDEIGMSNAAFDDPKDYRDVETLNYFKILDNPKDGLINVHPMGRDNARTPMQWTNEANGGFTTAQEGWIKSNPNFSEVNVASQEEDDASVLNFFRRMIAFRKEHLTLVYGDYESLQNEDQKIYAYRRWDEENEYLVVLNFSEDTVTVEAKEANLELLIYNYQDAQNDLNMRPWEAKLFKING